MFDAQTLFITGGTGSFGNKFVEMVNTHYRPKKIIIFSRDEMKQWEMKNRIKDTNVRFVIGDIRDRDRLIDVMRGVDYVVHAAATKIVPTAETNPEECIKTNVNGALNVIAAAKFNSVKRVIALSTDKASNPINLYGASKLASDKLFISANQGEDEKMGSIFSVVRYGNVMGSRGSVIPFFQDRKKTGKLPITDVRMTRFMISLEDAVQLVFHAFNDMVGGELYVRKIPSMNIVDLAEAICENCSLDIIGIRDGEKIHEQMISVDDAPYTYEYDQYYKILPSINEWHKDRARVKNGKKVAHDFIYTSENNNEWMSKAFLRKWLIENKEKFLKIETS